MEKRNNRIHKEWDICRTYDKILSGENKNFGPHFFCTDRNTKIITLTRYYIEDILKITPEEALETLTIEILEKDKLKCMLKYVDKPIEYQNDKTYVKHLIYFAYPKIKKPTFNEMVVECYKKVLDGRLNKFPKNYFKSVNGEKRAKICFDYLWQNVLKIDYQDIPKLFLDSNDKGLKILKQYKLQILISILYYSVSDMVLSLYPDILKYVGEKNA